MEIIKPLTTLDIAKNKLEADRAKIERIKDTRNRIRMDTPYVMTDWKGKKIEDCYPVTPNIAATFVEDVSQDLINDKWQVLLNGDISASAEKKVRKLTDALFSQTDEMLRKSRRTPSLQEWIANHICHTGMIGVQWYCEKDAKGELKVTCRPCDMLETPYEVGINGLDDGWICPIYYRPWYTVMKEYPQLMGRIQETKDLLQIWDWHDAEKDELWVGSGDSAISVPRLYGEEMMLSIPHKRGYVRFVVAGTSAGFQLKDKDSKKHEDEDILFLIRNLLDVKARNETIKLTVSMKSVRPAYEQQLKNPANAQKVPKDGQTLGVPEGGVHQIVDTGDIKQASRDSDQSTDFMISRGSVTSTNSDRQGQTPPSAMLVLEEAEMRSKRHTSRKNALQYFREDLTRLMLKQVAELKGPVKIGRLGDKEEYTDIRHPDHYSIKCRLMTKSKKLDYTNMMVGMNAMAALPPRFVYEHIMQIEDPEAVIEEMDIHRMRTSNPIFDMYCQAISSIRKAEDMEKVDMDKADYYYNAARILGTEIVQLLRARKQQLQGVPGQTGGAKVPDEVIAPKSNEGKMNPGNVAGPMMNNMMNF